MAQLALVTGGSRGIGRGICLELASRGWSVAINYAGNRTAAEECLELCRKTGGKGQNFGIFQADIGDLDSAEAMLSEIESAMGSLSALINNAGVAPQTRADLLEMEPKSFDRVVDTNLRGVFFLTQKIARNWCDNKNRLLKEGISSPKIVFISSVSANTVSLNRGEYCISKSGISMTAKLFAARLAAEDIMVYEIQPGIIRTDMTSTVVEKYDELIGNGLVPQARWGLPEDIAKAAAGLLGDDFNFSTGSVIKVDGGLSIPRL